MWLEHPPGTRDRHAMSLPGERYRSILPLRRKETSPSPFPTRAPNIARRETGGLPQHVTMATQHAADEADIRQRINQLTEAIRAMDLERVMSFYAPDIVSFDIVPPLQHLGAEAKGRN